MAFIDLQTAAATKTIKFNRNTTFQLIGTLTTETIDFKIPDGSGGWMLMYVDSSPVQLTATNNIVSFYSPATVRVDKPITASSAGVTLVS